ncbi:MAG: hypothetical protein A3B38_02735 [Candidatus Levybacteria bacterium RIFCSPLOWO2_01_FULL_36_13]|nr:MAG: hypothetical protein A2684_03930 [Candidatus Levybacteria bacterium RIFCSPHIGHO2_01_FULL_36_15b]OGH35194.1 MAG: hypothetical protein A3B38_02735 [Candidatus Levybacteria bacterium RIFCSPLOWO2_01_FULL_36_13]
MNREREPRIKTSASNQSLGLREEELQHVPAADDREEIVEFQGQPTLWEKARRAFSAMSEFRLFHKGNVGLRHDSNYATSENVDEARRKDKIKTRTERVSSKAGKFPLTTEFTERNVTGRRVRFEHESRAPIVPVEETEDVKLQHGSGIPTASRREVKKYLRRQSNTRLTESVEDKWGLPPAELKPTGVSLDALAERGIHIADE